MSRNRGVTLIECMIAVAITGIAGGSILSQFAQYQHRSMRAKRAAQLPMLLTVEMERLRLCVRTHGVAGCRSKLQRRDFELGAKEAATWAGAEIRHRITAGPDGTARVRVSARVGPKEDGLEALVNPG